ncbi:protein kinase [Achlya hypogyna]|uniref:Protein kinase n=1 Tax=Achlya hypogyna TaxID=1202772 RepID=A0A1V9ZU11_ACHHY|nr:protein kinase [Achlya hypogyna]
MQATAARRPRDAEADTDVEVTPLPSLWDTRRSANQLRLHAYETPVKNYVEVKIGGHPLDHKHAAQYRPSVASKPMKSAPAMAYGHHNSTPAFGVHHKEKLQYVEVKIGGHRYDHKRVVALDDSLVGFNDQLATIERGALGCAMCQSFQDAPLVQLYCRHAVCAPCFSTMTSNDSQTRVMCGVCFQKVPFLRPSQQQPGRDEGEDQIASVLPPVSPDTAAFAIACAGIGHYGPKAVRRISHALRSISIGPPTATSDMGDEDMCDGDMGDLDLGGNLDDVQGVVNAVADMDGAQRWANRVSMLLEPSKLLRYEYVRTLGHGNFSEVMLMKRRSSQRLCVLKESDKLQEAMNEVHLLSKLKSPHVLRLDQYFIEQIGHLHYVYLELEYCNRGTMHDYIESLNGARMKDGMFARLLLQLCSGLREIHRHAIVHRDIKPDNLLYTSEGVLKISDFGVSTCLESALVTRHAAGTMAFMAPEVRRYFLGEAVSYDWSADIWSLGAVAVAFLLGTNEPRVAVRPVDEVVADLAARQVPAQFLCAVKGALQPDPSKRATLEQITDLIGATYSKL